LFSDKPSAIKSDRFKCELIIKLNDQSYNLDVYSYNLISPNEEKTFMIVWKRRYLFVF